MPRCLARCIWNVSLTIPACLVHHLSQSALLKQTQLSRNLMTSMKSVNPTSLVVEPSVESMKMVILLYLGKEGVTTYLQAASAARSNHDIVLIYHHMATVIPQVGLQIWRGALLLADYILHRMYTSTDFQDVTAVELGAGTGLAGIVLARQAKLVFITDKDAEILDNCSRNVFANEDSFRYGEATVRVRELDWQQPWPPQVSTRNPKATYAFSEEDLADLQDATVLLAADVIYSDDLTDALFDILRKLMPAGSKKVLFLGLEKRYNFSMDDMDVVANGYANFLRYLNVEGNEQSKADFVGRRLELLSIPKFIQEYDRGTDLELWEIRRL